MPTTAFTPAQHGYHFANYFVNVIADVPGVGKLQTSGRCGGMAFSALDHFFFNLKLPPFTPADFAPARVPPDDHPLARYIYNRQIDSFLTLTAAKFVLWSLAPDGPSFFSKGVRRRTREDEWKRLRESIDRGVPVTLGLIVARDLGNLGRNHQVVAHGYDIDTAGGKFIVHLYDVNWPDQEITLTASADDATWQESSPAKEQWRGWFVQDYAAHRPSDNLAQPPAGATKGLELETIEKNETVTVRLKRLSFFNAQQPGLQEPAALVFSINGEQSRWPASGTRMIKHGKKVQLRRAIKVKVKPSAQLTITGRPVFDDLQAEIEDFDYFALVPESRPGSFSLRFSRDEKWGRGAHSVNSAGSAGGYTLDFAIEYRKAK